MQGQSQLLEIVRALHPPRRFARRLYGQGVEYVHIYDANQSQIRDPDLIYPGQVFEIPKDLDTTG